MLQVIQHKMVEGEQQIGGWKRPVAGLKPAIIVTVVGIGEAEEKFIFSTKMVVKVLRELPESSMICAIVVSS